MTAEHLSRLETGRRDITATIDLLVRLAVAWEPTRRRQIDVPADLKPFVGEHRVEHRDGAPPDREWVSVSA